MIIRPVNIGGATVLEAWIVGLKFPTWGLISSTTNCGIAWKNPADHTAVFGQDDGFDFATTGSTYIALNMDSADSIVSAGPYPSIQAQLYAVDATGADIYSVGGPFGGSIAGVYNFNFIQFQIAIGKTPCSGFRLQITLSSGSVGIFVPQTVYFFGDKSFA